MLLTLLIASTLSAAPAHEPVEPNTITLNTVAVATTGGQSAAVPSKTTRYCAVAQITGSRLLTRVCKTRDAWKHMGVIVPQNL